MDRVLRRAACATVLALALAQPAAAADCVTLAAAGNGLTKDLAVIMSTHGLENIIEARGLKGKGPVKTSCKDAAFGTECRSAQQACK